MPFFAHRHGDYGENWMSGDAIYAGALTAPEGNGNMPAWPKNFDDSKAMSGCSTVKKLLSSGGTFADFFACKAMCDGELHMFIVIPPAHRDLPFTTILKLAVVPHMRLLLIRIVVFPKDMADR